MIERPMSTHVIKSFDEDLQRLKTLVETMGDLTCRQLDAIVEAMERTDAGLAARVIEREPEADHQEHEIDHLVVQLLALRHPLATDLRHVLSALRIANELERICDHAENMARRLISSLHNGETERVRALVQIAEFAATMAKDAMRAYAGADSAGADDVWTRDKRLDEMYTGLFRGLLTYMMEDPRHISATVQILFIARDIERVGDRATNIAEMVSYFVEGTPVPEERPKADATPSIVAEALAVKSASGPAAAPAE